MAKIETFMSLYRAAGHAAPAIPARPVRYRSSAYEGASTGRRMKGWTATKGGPNSLIWTDGERMRDRAHDFARQSPSAGAALDAYPAAAIGTGIKPLSQYEDKKVREYLHKRWRRWTDEADFDEVTDFYGQQALAFRAMCEAGETLGRFRTPKYIQGMIPLKIQLLEAEYLPLDNWRTGQFEGVVEGNKVEYGIERDSEGRRAAYHIFKSHPDETLATRNSQGMVRIPADQMIHLYRPRRPGQLRGETWFAQVMTKLRQVENYDDAELARKGMVASLTGFLRKPDANAGTVFDEDEDGDVQLETGSWVELNPGEDVTFADPPPGDEMYDVYMRAQSRLIAKGFAGLAPYMMTGDASDMNFSSIRSLLIEFRRICEQIQYSTFVYLFCRRVWKEWIRVGVMSGELALPDYAKNRADYEDVEWITPGWPWVDPLKDVNAKIAELREGLTSRARIIAEKGEDVEQIDRENIEDAKRQKELRDKYGIVYGHNADQEQRRQNVADGIMVSPDDEKGRRGALLQ